MLLFSTLFLILWDSVDPRAQKKAHESSGHRILQSGNEAGTSSSETGHVNAGFGRLWETPFCQKEAFPTKTFIIWILFPLLSARSRQRFCGAVQNVRVPFQGRGLRSQSPAGGPRCSPHAGSLQALLLLPRPLPGLPGHPLLGLPNPQPPSRPAPGSGSRHTARCRTQHRSGTAPVPSAPGAHPPARPRHRCPRCGPDAHARQGGQLEELGARGKHKAGQGRRGCVVKGGGGNAHTQPTAALGAAAPTPRFRAAPGAAGRAQLRTAGLLRAARAREGTRAPRRAAAGAGRARRRAGSQRWEVRRRPASPRLPRSGPAPPQPRARTPPLGSAVGGWAGAGARARRFWACPAGPRAAGARGGWRGLHPVARRGRRGLVLAPSPLPWPRLTSQAVRCPCAAARWLAETPCVALGERLQRSEPRHRHSPRRPPAPRHPPPRSRRAQVTGPAAPGGRTATLPPPPGACGGPSEAAGRLHGAVPNPAQGLGGRAAPRGGSGSSLSRGGPLRGAAGAAQVRPRQPLPAGEEGAREGKRRRGRQVRAPPVARRVGATLWARERGWGRRLRRAGRKRGARAGAAGCGLPPECCPGAEEPQRPPVGRARFPSLRLAPPPPPVPRPGRGLRAVAAPPGSARGSSAAPSSPLPAGAAPAGFPSSVRLPGRGRGILRRRPRRWAEVSGINAR